MKSINSRSKATIHVAPSRCDRCNAELNWMTIGKRVVPINLSDYRTHRCSPRAYTAIAPSDRLCSRCGDNEITRTSPLPGFLRIECLNERCGNQTWVHFRELFDHLGATGSTPVVRR